MTRQSLALRREIGSSALRPHVPGYVSFRGATGEYLSATRPQLVSVSTLEVGIKVKLSSLTPAQNLWSWGAGVAKLAIAANPPGNAMTISLANVVAGTIGGAPSNVFVPAQSTTQPTWLRSRLTVSTAVCEYWYSYDATDNYDLVTWVAIGTPQTGTNAGTTPQLVGSANVNVASIGPATASMSGNVYAYVEKINGNKSTWFVNADIADAPKTTFTSAGGGQLWTMVGGLPTSFTPSQSYQGALRADFSFDETTTGLGPETLLGVIDLDHTTVRVSYQPGLIPDHPSLGSYDESMVIRSTAGFPATNLDGHLLMRYLSSDPMLNHGWASATDSDLLGQQWYYYTLFARYDETSGWFKVAEQAWLNPGNYGYPERMWQMFPNFYRRIDTGTWIYPGYTRRICDTIGYEMDVLRSYAMTVGDVWDFERISAKLLPEAGAALGLPQESANGDRRLRTLVGNAMALRKKKGTQDGIEGYIAALTGYPTRAYEGLNLLHRTQHAEWPNAFTASNNQGAAGSDNNPGWTSRLGSTTYGTVSRQTAAAGEGAPVGMADGTYYLRMTNDTGAGTTADFAYGSDHADNGTNGILAMVPVIGGHSYKFSTAIKASAASTVTTVRIDWYDQYGGVVSNTGNLTFVTVGTAWVRVVTPSSFTAPATACYARLRLLVPASLANTGHLNIWRPMFVDMAWRPEGIPTLTLSNDPLSSSSAGDLGTYLHKDYYEAPREVKVNVYPNRANLALNSDFTLNNLPPGAWTTFEGPTYAQLPVAYSSYADIIDAEPGDSEVDYADMAAGLAPFTSGSGTIIWDPAGGRIHINKTTQPYGFTLTHTYFDATELGGMSAAVGAYSSATAQTEAQGYLNPLVGTVTTPDPGPLPDDCCFVFKVRGPTTSSENIIVAQWETNGQLSWYIARPDATNGALLMSPSTNGSAPLPARTTPAITNTQADQFLAFSATFSTGGFRSWSSADGITWTPGALQTSAPFPLWDANTAMRIGGRATGAGPFNGRIYSVELRSGSEPASTANRYLVPTIGTVSTPDPGPLPRECVFVFKVQGSTTSGPDAICGQWFSEPQASWLLDRSSTLSLRGTRFVIVPTGMWASAVQTFATLPLPTGAVEELAVSVKHGASPVVNTSWVKGPSGWSVVSTESTATAVVPFDSNALLRIGTTGFDPHDGRIYSVELRTGLDPNVGGSSTWTPGYIDFPVGSLGNQVHASITAPSADASGSIRIECERQAMDGQIHAPIGSAYFLLYLPFLDGNAMYYFYDTTLNAQGNAVSPAQMTAAGVPASGRWQFKITWNATTDTLSFHGRDPALGLDLMDETGWTLIHQTVMAGKQMRSDGGFQQINGTAWQGSGKVWRSVMEVNGAIKVDFDFRYLRSDPGAAMVLPSGQTATITRHATTPLAVTSMVDGLLWKFDANDAPLDATTASWTDPRGRTWTATNPLAISERLVWRFDANDYPGTGTVYTDPRGRVWTATSASAITPYKPASAGTQLTLAFEWYTDNDIAYRILDPVTGQPVRTTSRAHTLTNVEGRYEVTNAQPPANALYGRLLVIVSNSVPHDTSLTWALIEDAPYPEAYFNGNFPDGDDGDFYFAIGRGYTGDAHLSPSLYYQQFKHFAYAVGGSDALSQLLPRLLPFRRSFKIVHGATGLYNLPS